MTAGTEAMIAACPHCGARYRIERERVPEQGARLRCSRCEAIFRVSLPARKVAEQPAGKAVEGRSSSGARPSSGGAGPRSGRELLWSSAELRWSSAEAGGGGPPPARVARGAEPRRLVLVADPDVAAGKALAGALSASGIEPLLVHDGVEAVLSIQRTLPSLVVLEASLPKMFGFQVCELMKRNEQLRAIPVVLVGAIHHRERYRRQAAETYGADAYVERPELPETLFAILQRLGIVAAPAPAAPPPAARSQAEASGVPDRRLSPTGAPAPAGRSSSTGAPAPAGPAPRGPGPDPELAADIARAERLARIIVSDIVLYNPERFEAAIRSGDLARTMAAELEEGRAHFRERISERVRGQRDFLGEELARVARQRGAK